MQITQSFAFINARTAKNTTEQRPGYMTKMTIKLDPDDERAVHKAIALQQQVSRIDGKSTMPNGDSCSAGAYIAEICRDWIDYMDRESPRNDGT